MTDPLNEMFVTQYKQKCKDVVAENFNDIEAIPQDRLDEIIEAEIEDGTYDLHAELKRIKNGRNRMTPGEIIDALAISVFIAIKRAARKVVSNG